jgi:hypothetical protein
MTLPTYSTGAVSVTNGGTTVTGAGAIWSGANAKEGDFFVRSDGFALITEVTDATHLKITPWPGATVSGGTYSIEQNYNGRVVGVAAAQDVGTMLKKLHTSGLPFIVDIDETVPDPSLGDNGQYAYKPDTAAWWIKTGGAWVLTTAPVKGYGGTSATSLVIGAGTKVFTTDQTGLAYNGARVRAASAADPTNWMAGTVTYSGTTLTMLVDLTGGSGTRADWLFSIDGSKNTYAAPFDALAYNGMQVNGSCDVVQETGTSAIAFAAGTIIGRYVADCIQVTKTGSSAFSVQQVASVFPGYNSELKATITTAATSSDEMDFNWLIEGYRFQRAMWGTSSAVPVTIGFWAKSSVSGTIGVIAINGAITATASPSSSDLTLTANTAKWCTATFPATTTGTWLTTNGIGCTIRVYAMQNGSPNFTGTLSNTFEITGMVVLPGTELPSLTRAPFIMRPYDQELQSCKRYFYNGAPGLIGITSSSTNADRMTCRHPVAMRANPSATLTSAVTLTYGGNGAWAFQNTSTIASNASDTQFLKLNFTGSGFPIGAPVAIDQGVGNINVDARL